MIIGGDFSPRAKELYERLYTKEFDSESLSRDLNMGRYNADDVNQAAVNYVSDCCELHLEFDEFWSCRGVAGEQPRESDHVTTVIGLLLPYGLDPNKIYKDPCIVGKPIESNIMVELYAMYDGYQAADSLKLLLRKGGDPFLVHDGLPLIDYVSHDLYDGLGFLDDMNDEAFDAMVHYWMVLVSKASKQYRKKDQPIPMLITPYDMELEFLEDHRRFFWGHGYISEAEKDELLVFEGGHNLLAVRFHHNYSDEPPYVIE